METKKECKGCFLRQVEAFFTLAGVTDKNKAEEIKRKIEKDIDNLSPNPFVSSGAHNVVTSFCTEWYRQLYASIDNKDPYKKIKIKANEMALLALEQLKKQGITSLKEIAMATIIGNLMDFSFCVGGNYDLDKISTDIDKVKSEDLTINDLDLLQKDLENAKTILYLHDNNGELIFDTLLLEYFQKYLPKENIFLAGKESPLVTDVTFSDLKKNGFEKYGKIISIGTNGFGLDSKEVSKEFKKILKSADIIIAKGQAYYEFFTEFNFNNVYNIFRVKCDLLAKFMGDLPPSSNVVISSRRYLNGKKNYPY